MKQTTERSLIWLRKHGFMPGVVERKTRVGKFFKKNDLYGCLDLVAVPLIDLASYGPHPFPALGVQTTSSDHLAERVEKLITAKWRAKKGAPEIAVLPALLAAGWTIEVHGWRKLKSTGRWTVRIFNMKSMTERDG